MVCAYILLSIHTEYMSQLSPSARVWTLVGPAVPCGVWVWCVFGGSAPAALTSSHTHSLALSLTPSHSSCSRKTSCRPPGWWYHGICLGGGPGRLVHCLFTRGASAPSHFSPSSFLFLPHPTASLHIFLSLAICRTARHISRSLSVPISAPLICRSVRATLNPVISSVNMRVMMSVLKWKPPLPFFLTLCGCVGNSGTPSLLTAWHTCITPPCAPCSP